jgi:hypothetical protein
LMMRVLTELDFWPNSMKLRSFEPPRADESDCDVKFNLLKETPTQESKNTFSTRRAQVG